MQNSTAHPEIVLSNVEMDMGHLGVQVETEIDHWVTGCGQRRFLYAGQRKTKILYICISACLAQWSVRIFLRSINWNETLEWPEVVKQQKSSSKTKIKQFQSCPLVSLARACFPTLKVYFLGPDMVRSIFSLKEYNFCFSFNLRILFWNHELIIKQIVFHFA